MRQGEKFMVEEKESGWGERKEGRGKGSKNDVGKAKRTSQLCGSIK